MAVSSKSMKPAATTLLKSQRPPFPLKHKPRGLRTPYVMHCELPFKEVYKLVAYRDTNNSTLCNLQFFSFALVFTGYKLSLSRLY